MKPSKHWILAAVAFSAISMLLTGCSPSAGLPVAHWTFDEVIDATVKDSVGNNDGKLINNPTWTKGWIGSALCFDGIDDGVMIQNHDSLDITDRLTVSAWIITKDIDTRQMIVAKNAQWHDSWLLEINPLDFEGTRFNFRLNLYGFKCDFGSTTIVSPNKWYHVVATYDGSERKIYINGKLDTSQAVHGSIAENDQPIIIGAYENASRLFKGTIDDVRIYKKALSANQIWDLYDSSLN